MAITREAQELVIKPSRRILEGLEHSALNGIRLCLRRVKDQIGENEPDRDRALGFLRLPAFSFVTELAKLKRSISELPLADLRREVSRVLAWVNRLHCDKRRAVKKGHCSTLPNASDPRRFNNVRVREGVIR